MWYNIDGPYEAKAAEQTVRIADDIRLLAVALFTEASAMKTNYEKYIMDKRTVDAIVRILDQGDRAELIPVRNGVRIYGIRRREYAIREDADAD